MRQIPDDIRIDIAFLVFAARTRQFPTYTEHGRLRNNSARGHQEKLEAVNQWCRDNGFPQLATLVCKAGTTMPDLTGFTGPRWQAFYPGWNAARVREEQQACLGANWDYMLKTLRDEQKAA
jgi:hypothetical protein